MSKFFSPRSEVFMFAVAALSATAFSAACSKHDASPAPAEKVQTQSAQDLQGSWKSTCSDAQLFGLSESSSLTVDGSKATQVTSTSAQGDCASTAVEVTQMATLTPTTVNGMNHVDITVTSAKVKPLNETGVGILNLASFCGMTDWKVGEERDITQQSGGGRCYPKLPKTYYNVYGIEDGKLYFGSGDINHPEYRPTILNRQRMFTRL